MNSNRMLGITTFGQAKVTEKLSSGYRINRAADDAAGLAISEKMRRQIRGLTQATANAQDGISCLQTAEGALNEVHDMLQRMNELAIKAGNETLQSVDLQYIQSELNALRTEIDRVAETTTFNEAKLLDGNFSAGKRIQVGAEVQSPNQIRITINRMSWAAITFEASKYNVTLVAASGADIEKTHVYKDGETLDREGVLLVSGTGFGSDAVDGNYKNITATVSTIKWALKMVSTMRSDMGAVQNRLEHTIANLKNVVENTTAAESAIRDTDMAETMVKFANLNVLAQAGQAMLAQSNQANQGVLALL
jgi:flagellin